MVKSSVGATEYQQHVNFICNNINRIPSLVDWKGFGLGTREREQERDEKRERESRRAREYEGEEERREKEQREHKWLRI